SEGGHVRLLVPLFFWYSREGGRKATFVSPLGGYDRDDTQGERTAVFLPGPIIFRRDREREVDIVSPLYIRHRDLGADATTRSVALLFYRRADPGGSTTALFPLFWHWRDAATGGTATALLPFFFHRTGPKDTTTAAGVFPLWFYRRKFADGGWSAGL